MGFDAYSIDGELLPAPEYGRRLYRLQRHQYSSAVVDYRQRDETDRSAAGLLPLSLINGSHPCQRLCLVYSRDARRINFVRIDALLQPHVSTFFSLGSTTIARYKKDKKVVQRNRKF